MNQDNTAEKYAAYLQTLQNFSRKVVASSPALMTDLNYYENKVTLIRKGIFQMMEFFGMDTKFRRLKMQTKFSPNNAAMWKPVEDQTQLYNILVDKIQTKSIQLYRFNDYLAQNLKSIASNSVQNVDGQLQSFDKVIDFSIKLIELKDSLVVTIADLKKTISEFNILQFNVKMLLNGIAGDVDQKLAEIDNEKKKQLQEEAQKKEADLKKVKFASILGLCWSFLLIV